MKIVPVTNAVFEIIEQEWLARAESVHRQLRPTLPPDYARRMKEIFAAGAEMAVAVVADAVRGVCVFRMLNNTSSGLALYCDDLVADETTRSTGVGHAMIAYMEALARERGCNVFTLDSGTQRQKAHKFYFREGFTVVAFHFAKPLK
jgi:GNAT superfamily N-acetyltransferase